MKYWIFLALCQVYIICFVGYTHVFFPLNILAAINWSTLKTNEKSDVWTSNLTYGNMLCQVSYAHEVENGKHRFWLINKNISNDLVMIDDKKNYLHSQYIHTN